MDSKILILGVLFAVSSVVANNISYKDHVVYKIVPETMEQVRVLKDLQRQTAYKFWSDYIKLGKSVKIMIAREKVVKFEEYLTNKGMEAKVIFDDVQRVIDDQLKRPPHTRQKALEYAWDYYPTLEEIDEWLQKTVEAHPDVASIVIAGRSVEGRYIRGIKIDFKKKANPVIGFIEGTLHAREWISPVTTTWMIKEFLTSANESVRALADNVVWHIFPVVNPDGYVYTFTDNRMWRKNRNPANFVSCAKWDLDDDWSNGIDLNRNFGFMWMTAGASSNPCTDNYAGPHEFSEPEAVAIANYIRSLQRQGNLLYYFSFHSYFNIIFIPFSHRSGMDNLKTPNYADMYEIAIRGTDALKARHGTEYDVGTLSDIIQYEIGGSSFDWAKGGAEIPLSFLFEFRDEGEYGFLLPADQIIPNSEEVLDAIVEMDRTTRALGYYQSSGNTFGINGILVAIIAIFVSSYNYSVNK